MRIWHFEIEVAGMKQGSLQRLFELIENVVVCDSCSVTTIFIDLPSKNRKNDHV